MVKPGGAAVTPSASGPAVAAGAEVVNRHLEGQQGVRARNSDNTGIAEVLQRTPQVSLEKGLAKTYAWIDEKVRARLEQWSEER